MRGVRPQACALVGGRLAPKAQRGLQEPWCGGRPRNSAFAAERSAQHLARAVVGVRHRLEVDLERGEPLPRCVDPAERRERVAGLVLKVPTPVLENATCPPVPAIVRDLTGSPPRIMP